MKVSGRRAAPKRSRRPWIIAWVGVTANNAGFISVLGTHPQFDLYLSLPSTGPAFRPNNRSHKIRGGLFWAILINQSALFVYLSCVNSGPLVLFFCGPFNRLKRILYCSRWFRSFYTLMNNLIKHIILLDKLRPNKCVGLHFTTKNVISN